MNGKTILVALTMFGALLAFTPNAAANDVCDPTNSVCVVNDTGAGEDYDCDGGYLSQYGPNDAKNGVSVNAAGVSASAYAYEACGHWFFHDTHSYGFRADADAGEAEAHVRWVDYTRDANPWCFWNAQDAQGTVISATGSAGGNAFGVVWRDEDRQDCRTGNTVYDGCTTTLMLGPAGTEEMDCPAGAPPSPPTPEELPYGQLLPL